MKTKLFPAAGVAVVLLVTGCASPLPPGAERGPHGTMAYDVLVEASDPGAKIEVNGTGGQHAVAPEDFGNRNGTFHDFESYYYILRAYPVTTNQFQQIRVFETGRNDTRQDLIPQHIYFDMNQNVPVQVPADPPRYYSGPILIHIPMRTRTRTLTTYGRNSAFMSGHGITGGDRAGGAHAMMPRRCNF